jgi:hypothetical protein
LATLISRINSGSQSAPSVFPVAALTSNVNKL